MYNAGTIMTRAFNEVKLRFPFRTPSRQLWKIVVVVVVFFIVNKKGTGRIKHM